MNLKNGLLSSVSAGRIIFTLINFGVSPFWPRSNLSDSTLFKFRQVLCIIKRKGISIQIICLGFPAQEGYTINAAMRWGQLRFSRAKTGRAI